MLIKRSIPLANKGELVCPAGRGGVVLSPFWGYVGIIFLQRRILPSQTEV